ncbi:MAG: TetR/AcrR family transcriptional regulator [Clostridiales bacterium]|nr:TetR/AcrR family transcriptional regulator [Clostridiales bacterium]
MKEKGNTRERILEEAIKLFSIKGYDAVSVRAIADEVGIVNSALYKFYDSKQDIFDTIVDRSKERYLDTCTAAVNRNTRGAEQIKEVCLGMYNYQTNDQWIVMFRKILTMEQFKNPKMAEIYKEFFIDIPLRRQQEIFKVLIAKGYMKNRDPNVLAMELYAPFYMYHMVKADEGELMKLFTKHAEYFFENNVLIRSE